MLTWCFSWRRKRKNSLPVCVNMVYSVCWYVNFSVCVFSTTQNYTWFKEIFNTQCVHIFSESPHGCDWIHLQSPYILFESQPVFLRHWVETENTWWGCFSKTKFLIQVYKPGISMQYHQKCVGVPCSYNFDSFLNTSGKQYVPLLHCVQEFFLLEQSEQLIHRQMVLDNSKKPNEGRGSSKTALARACAVCRLKLGAEPN